MHRFNCRGFVHRHALARGCRRGCDHVRVRSGRSCDQIRNERGLGQIAPVFFRHLGAQRVLIDARRVEGRAIICEPPVLDGVFRLRCVVRRNTRPETATRPSQCTDASGVRIDQRIEAKRSTKNGVTCAGCDARARTMRRSVRRASGVSTGRKRRNAVILWRSRRTAFCMPSSRCTNGSEATRSSERSPCVEPPQQPIEQREAFRIAMTSMASGQRRKPAGTDQGFATGRPWPIQTARRIGCFPDVTNSGAISAASRPRTGSRNSSKPRRDGPDTTRYMRSPEQLSCSGGGAIAARRSARSSIRGPMIGGDDERPNPAQRSGEPRDIVEPQRAMLARQQHPIDASVRRDRESAAASLARRPVYIDRESDRDDAAPSRASDRCRDRACRCRGRR